MEINEEQSEDAIDFAPALCFLRRNIAKEKPERVILSQNELANIVQSNGHASSDEESENNENVDNNQMEGDDEYMFENYEEEENSRLANIADIADINEQVEDEDDSEAEDEIIKPTDNLILVGRVTGVTPALEVWVFNQEEECLYTHHDFLLPHMPLCIEWLNHDPGSETDGNICAIGSMDPIITLWDLDIQDALEPILKLGSKGNRKKNKPKYGHTDAVTTLSWNTNFPHVLASGSVDKSVILWDLDEGLPHTTFNMFKGKILSIAFHPDEAQCLLTGSDDKRVYILDCREEYNKLTTPKWKFESAVEKVQWNPIEKNYFIVGTNNGSLHYADKRQNKEFLWSIEEAHRDELSGICFNSQMKNLLTTTSADGMLKIWNFNESQIREVYSHDFNMGRIMCLQQCPEDPFTLAIGGEKPPTCRVYNIKNFDTVRAAFQIEENA